MTKAGNEPSWSTVRSRYWKNEAYYHADEYEPEDLAYMEKGHAPHYPLIDVPMELYHIEGRNIPNANSPENLLKVWPWEHAEIDNNRYYTGVRP